MALLKVRRMEPDEVEQTVAVWERSRWESLPWLEQRMGHSHEDNLRFFRETIMRENEVWVAESGGRVVGLLALRGSLVDRLYVEPEWQRRGVGRALLEKARELSPTELRLFTLQRNERARRFYEAHGFRVEALGVSPPPESEPDVLYVWADSGTKGKLRGRGGSADGSPISTTWSRRASGWPRR